MSTRILTGHAIDVLREMPAGSVAMCVSGGDADGWEGRVTACLATERETMPMTQHDMDMMERLVAAVLSEEVSDRSQWDALCDRLRATEAHRFTVAMSMGGRLPWDRVMARHTKKSPPE